jgi:hypothetical protein
MRLRKRRYHTGGGIPPHPHPHTGIYADVPEDSDVTTEDLDVLQSLVPDPLVSDNTQLSTYGYTPPLDPFASQITLIPEKELTWEEGQAAQSERIQKIQELQLLEYIQAIIEGKQESFMQSPELINLINEEKAYQKKRDEEYEAQHGVIDERLNYPRISPDVRWMFPQGMSMDDINRYVYENPYTNPLGMLAIAETIALTRGVSPMVIPGTAHIGGGVTVGNVMNAYFLKEGVEGLVKHVPEFIDDPSWGGAGNIAVDALLAYPGMKGLKTNVLDPFVKAYKKAKNSGNVLQMKKAIDDFGHKYTIWNNTVQEGKGGWIQSGYYPKPKIGGPKIGASSSSQPTAASADELASIGSQLTSELPAVSGEAGALQQLVDEAIEASSPVLQNLAKNYQTERGVRTKKGGYVSEEAPYLESNIAKGSSSVDTGDFDAVPGVVQDVENLGVYQYPGLMKGSILEKSVKAKDGSISKSVVKDYANNLPKNATREKNAILNALVELEQEFPGKTIDYEALRSYVSLNIKPATVIETKDYANYGLERINYHTTGAAALSPDAVGKTLVYQDESLGIVKGHGTIKDDASYWIRSFTDPNNPEIYYVTEWQSDLQNIKDPIGAAVIERSEPLSPELETKFLSIQTLTDNVLKTMVDDVFLKNEYSTIHYFLNDLTMSSQVDGAYSNVKKLLKKVKKDLEVMAHDEANMDKFRFEEIWGDSDLVNNRKRVLSALEKSLTEARNDLVAYVRKLPENNLDLYKSQSEGINLKWINESMLDAARSGQTTMRVPTPETSRKIQDHHHPESRPFEMVHKKYKDFPKYYKKEFGVEVRQVTDSKGNSWWEVDIPEKYFNQNMMYMEGEVKTPSEFKTYKKGGILQAMAKKNRPAKNKFVSNKVRVLKKEGKSLKEAVAIALDMWKRGKVKKYGAGGSVEDFGAQGNFTTEYTSRQPEVEELEDPNEKSGGTTVTIIQEEEELSKEEQRGLKGKAAGRAAGKGALMGAKIGSFLPGLGTGIGAAVGAAVGGIGTLLANRKLKKQEQIMAEKGVKIKKKKYDNGGLFEKLRDRREKIKAAKDFYLNEEENPWMNEEGKIIDPWGGEEITPRQYKNYKRWQFRDYKRGLRQQDRQERQDERVDRRAKRRLGRTDIMNMPNWQILDYLAGKHGNAGYFRPGTGDVYMNPASKSSDESVEDHELIHSTHMGPLQRLASSLGIERAGRIQDKDSRKAFKKLYKSIRKEGTALDDKYTKWQTEQGREKDEIKTGLGDYMMGKKAQDVEFDAIIKSGLSSAESQGLDLSNKTFDEVLNQLKQAKDSESTNMHHLRRFMNDTSWTDEQKELIMDAIKANLGRKAFTAEDARQDLR